MDEIFQEVELADGTKMKVVPEDKFAEFQSKTEEELKAREEELAKEKAKEKNFAALRQKKLSELTEEQKAELTEREQAIMARQEEVDAKMSAWEQAQKEKDEQTRNSWKLSAFENLGVVDSDGNILDEDAFKKLDGAFSRLNDPEDSASAVLKKAKAAYSLEFGSQPNIGERSVHSAIPFGGGGTTPKKAGGFSETQKDLAGKLGMGDLFEDKK